MLIRASRFTKSRNSFEWEGDRAHHPGKGFLYQPDRAAPEPEEKLEREDERTLRTMATATQADGYANNVVSGFPLFPTVKGRPLGLMAS